jgi:hypothetical protein
MARTNNDGRATVAKKDETNESILSRGADILEESRANGGSFFSKLVTFRQEETEKVFIVKAFADGFRLFSSVAHLPVKASKPVRLKIVAEK